VALDIAAAKTKVAPKGFLLFNDYAFWSPTECMPYGVVRAVNELCLSDNWEFAYLALGNFGYMDVALRRRKRRSLLSFLKVLGGRQASAASVSHSYVQHAGVRLRGTTGHSSTLIQVCDGFSA